MRKELISDQNGIDGKPESITEQQIQYGTSKLKKILDWITKPELIGHLHDNQAEWRSYFLIKFFFLVCC